MSGRKIVMTTHLEIFASHILIVMHTVPNPLICACWKINTLNNAQLDTKKKNLGVVACSYKSKINYVLMACNLRSSCMFRPSAKVSVKPACWMAQKPICLLWSDCLPQLYLVQTEPKQRFWRFSVRLRLPVSDSLRLRARKKVYFLADI